jgi:prepilin signal peptidase PulO-like enzyme (type II secretory pathway)
MEKFVDMADRTRRFEGFVIKAFWPPVAVFVLHVTMLVVLNAYIHIPRVDMPMHFFGGVAVAYTFWLLGSLAQLEARTPRVAVAVRGILTFALTCAAAVFWEFFEYALTVLTGVSLAGSYLDTILDMFLGVLGGMAYALGRTLGAWPRGA